MLRGGPEFLKTSTVAMAGKTTTNLSDLAFFRLERLLITLEMAPGAELRERELVERLEMGRTPVREAVQRLAQMGLIEVAPRLGLRVSCIRPDDFQRVMALRTSLEPALAREATEGSSAGQRAEIDACSGAMRTAAETRDIRLFLAADKTFDRILAQAADNAHLARALEPLQTHARRLWFHHVGEAGLARSAGLHLPVMEAFVQGDADAAEKAMRRLVDGMSAEAIASEARR